MFPTSTISVWLSTQWFGGHPSLSFSFPTNLGLTAVMMWRWVMLPPAATTYKQLWCLGVFEAYSMGWGILRWLIVHSYIAHFHGPVYVVCRLSVRSKLCWHIVYVDPYYCPCRFRGWGHSWHMPCASAFLQWLRQDGLLVISGNGTSVWKWWTSSSKIMCIYHLTVT